LGDDRERRDPNRPGDGAAEEEVGPVEEAQGSPGDPADIVDETGTVDETVEAPEEDGGEEQRQTTVPAEELDAALRERDEYLDALRRLKAEFENSRKRQERERGRLLETASEKVVRELLPVLDNLDRALESEGDIRGGVQATRDQLADVLRNEGLLPVASDGQPFDPNVHEAVMGQPSEEHEEGTVLQTFQTGYLLNGKAIRPAKVVVAKQV
jgi:molecular chaperone GrpE